MSQSEHFKCEQEDTHNPNSEPGSTLLHEMHGSNRFRFFTNGSHSDEIRVKFGYLSHRYQMASLQIIKKDSGAKSRYLSEAPILGR